jgi:hypothetical protein
LRNKNKIKLRDLFLGVFGFVSAVLVLSNIDADVHGGRMFSVGRIMKVSLFFIIGFMIIYY